MLSFTHNFTELMIGVDSHFGVKHGVFLVDFFKLCLLTGGVEAGELLCIISMACFESGAGISS